MKFKYRQQPRLTWLRQLLFAGSVMASSTAHSEASDLAANGEVAKGKQIFMLCQACHSPLAEYAGIKIGPHLQGIFNRKAGTLESFSYSPAMRSQEFVWTEEQLDKWLQQPSSVVAGTTMNFPGIANIQTRKALIAYLKTL